MHIGIYSNNYNTKNNYQKETGKEEEVFPLLPFSTFQCLPFQHLEIKL